MSLSDKALQITNAQTIKIALRQEISRSEESRYDQRLHGILLMCQGQSRYDAAQWLEEHSPSVERLVHRFEVAGFQSLHDGEREGRPGRLVDQTWRRVAKNLRCHPRDLGYGQNLWDGKLLSHHLREQYQVRLGTRQWQQLFRSMGFRRRIPQPLIGQADPIAQAVFKGTRHAGENTALDLWSLDERHFQQYGSCCTMCLQLGETDPVVLHAQTRKSLALFEAVSLTGGQMIAHFHELFDAQSFLVFLQPLLRRRSRGKIWSLLQTTPDTITR